MSMRDLLKRTKTLLSLINMNGNTRSGESVNLYKAIEAELAKPETKPDPVAWRMKDIFSRFVYTEQDFMFKQWVEENISAEPLYDSPPAQQKSLTDDEIIEIADEAHRSMKWGSDDQDEIIKIARAIERKIRGDL